MTRELKTQDMFLLFGETTIREEQTTKFDKTWDIQPVDIIIFTIYYVYHSVV